jgi:hypothetical protein
VHTGVVEICYDQPVSDSVVFGFVTWWKEDFLSIFNCNFAWVLMMGVFSRVCSGVFWGMRKSAVSDSGRRQWLFFWVGGIGNGKRRYRGPWNSRYVSLHVTSSNSPNLCIYVLYYVLYYINSLCSGGFTDTTTVMCWSGVCWGYDTDVTWTGCDKYIGHELVNWWGWGGRRSEHCRRYG